MRKGTASQLLRIWVGSGIIVAVLSAVIYGDRRSPGLIGADTPPVESALSLADVATWAMFAVFGVMIALTIRALVRRPRATVVLRAPKRLATTPVSTTAPEVSSAAAEQPIKCGRCGAPAVRMFGFTQEPVCMACYDKPGLCQSCGKQFGSDAELVVIGAGKNCRQCDARLEQGVYDGFRSRTIIR